MGGCLRSYFLPDGIAADTWIGWLKVSYEPRKDSKLNRFTNMEGHLEVPVDDQSIYAELQKNWVQKYFRTRDGRLQWFAVSCFSYPFFFFQKAVLTGEYAF